MDADAISDLVAQTVEPDIEWDFIRFINRVETRHWIILSDYVIDDATRPHDTIAITVMPLFKDVENFNAHVNTVSRGDLKRVKRITPSMIEILNKVQHFSFCFVLNKDRRKAWTPTDARRAIAETVRRVEEYPNANQQSELIRKTRMLQERAQSGHFKFGLLQDISIVCGLVGFISYLLAKHSSPKAIVWASDRDNITAAYDGVALHFWPPNLAGLCQKFGVDDTSIQLGVLTPEKCIDGTEKIWIDALLRIPDYIAGTLATTELESINVLRPKFGQLLEDVIADNDNIAIVRISIGRHYQTDRVRVHRHLRSVAKDGTIPKRSRERLKHLLLKTTDRTPVWGTAFSEIVSGWSSARRGGTS